MFSKKIGRRRALKAGTAMVAVPVLAPKLLERPRALSGQADGPGVGIAVERKISLATPLVPRIDTDVAAFRAAFHGSLTYYAADMSVSLALPSFAATFWNGR